MKFSKRSQRNHPWVPLIATDVRGFKERKKKEKKNWESEDLGF